MDFLDDAHLLELTETDGISDRQPRRRDPEGVSQGRGPDGFQLCELTSRMYDISNRRTSFRRCHESDLPAARANEHHRDERVRISGLCVLLQGRALCNASGRMYAGAGATRA